MRIYSIQNNYQTTRPKPRVTPTFQQSWLRESLTSLKSTRYDRYMLNRNDTFFFRPNPSWKELTSLLEFKFSDVPKVNVYDYACSNGSEAYTFLMEMFSECSENFVKKFLPVIAKDVDPVAIKKATQRGIAMETAEINSINMHTRNNFTKFFNESGFISDDEEVVYVPKPILKDNVIFSQANILNDIENIEPENTVVFARNFWPYLLAQERVELAQKLGERLKSNSVIVFGDFDTFGTQLDTPIETLLRNVGFEDSGIRFIMEK